MLAEIKRAGVKHYKGISQLTALGDGDLNQVSFRHSGKTQTIDAKHLLVHQGVIPNTQFSRAMGIEHLWNPIQQTWQPKADTWGDMGEKRFMAGDGAGIGGAVSAELAAVSASERCRSAISLRDHSIALARPFVCHS